MPKANYAKYVILGLLSYSPMTGYDIKKWCDEFLKYLLMDISYGQIYPILSRLKQGGLAVEVPPAAGKRSGSKTYQLTDKGLEELRAWVKSPDTKEYDVLLKMCFGSLISREEMARKLDAYRQKRKGELAMMNQYLAEAGDATLFGENTLYITLITRLGLEYFEQEVKWCDEAIAGLQKET